MDDYTRYIILSHIYWSENEITLEKLKEVASEIKGKDIFMQVDAQKVNLKLGYKILYKEEISIEDFAKIDLRVATILTAVRVPKTDKLMKLSVKIGDEERIIVSGIAQHYTEEQLVGRNVIVIANLKAAKLRGIESRGMLLAASDGQGNLILADAPGIASGSKVK